eukprot:6198070-Pleurochrysis_carterae.AAC.5
MKETTCIDTANAHSYVVKTTIRSRGLLYSKWAIPHKARSAWAQHSAVRADFASMLARPDE